MDIARTCQRFLLTFCLLVFVGNPSSTQAARISAKKINASWEALMGNSLVLSYYSMGIVADLYRSGIYKRPRAQRYARVIHKMLREDVLFLRQIKVRGSKANRALLRKFRSTLHILYIGANSLQLAILRNDAKKMKDFLTYRNAVAADIGKVLQDPALRKKRRYKGGLSTATSCLGHYLGVDLVYAYLINGMVADAYFKRVLNRQQAEGYLKPAMNLMKTGALVIDPIRAGLAPSDQIYTKKLRRGLQVLYLQATMLQRFMRTRDRKWMAKYLVYRKQAWSYVALVGS